jgi:hypothetical protein
MDFTKDQQQQEPGAKQAGGNSHAVEDDSSAVPVSGVCMVLGVDGALGIEGGTGWRIGVWMQGAGRGAAAC